MAENVKPGLDGEMCIELDVLEANNWAMQTAIHTEQGGKYGSGRCDRDGCFARIGGTNSPRDLQRAYGPTSNKIISTLKPFDVESTVDGQGSLTIKLKQDGKSVTSFSRAARASSLCFSATAASCPLFADFSCFSTI